MSAKFSSWSLALAPVALLPLGCGRSPAEEVRQAVPAVTVAKPLTKQVVEWDAYTGRLEAVDFVEVRARVSGYLQSVHFVDGQVVQAGDLLFVIDPRPYEAELSGAEAMLKQAQAQLRHAEAQRVEATAQQSQADAQLTLARTRVERARMLLTRDAASREEVDEREAEFLQARADREASEARIQSAEAEIATAESSIDLARSRIETAELNLQYTRIHAPVAGRISRRFVTAGNLIGGGSENSTLLTTITSVDPIYCTFDASEQDVLKYIRLAQAGQRVSSRVAKNPVFLALTDEEGFPHQGHMDFVDNRFDTETAGMRARCIFPNGDQVLVPGMFARIRIPGSAPRQSVLIPDAAISTDQSSQFVFIVAEGVVERRVVVPGPIIDGLRVIRSGLSGEEWLVTEGLLKVRPGLEVETNQAEIVAVEDGLPDSYEPLPPEAWITPPVGRDAVSRREGQSSRAEAPEPAPQLGGAEEA